MAASTKFVRRAWKSFLDNKGHDFTTSPHLEIVSARPGHVTAKSIKASWVKANRMGSLHGGLTSSLIDSMGSLALSSKGLWMTGVSTDISVTFVRGAMVGEEVTIKGEVVGQGKTLAYTRVDIFNSDNGKLLAYGSHTKYIAQALKSDKNIKISDDGETEL